MQCCVPGRVLCRVLCSVSCSVPCSVSCAPWVAFSLVCACVETKCDNKTALLKTLLGPLLLADFQGRRNDCVSSPLWSKPASWRLNSSSMPVFTAPADPVIVVRVSVDQGHGAGIALGCCAVPGGAVVFGAALCCFTLRCVVRCGAVRPLGDLLTRVLAALGSQLSSVNLRWGALHRVLARYMAS